MSKQDFQKSTNFDHAAMRDFSNDGSNVSTSSSEIRPWEIAAAWLLRSLIVFTIGLHLYRGAWLYSLLCFLALILIMIPPFIARTNQVNLPVEIELVALWWLVADMTLGRLMGLYQTSIWYDKVIHLGNSGLFALIAFLTVYTLKTIGQLKTGYLINLFAIVLVTLGLGALWEILEFVTDSFFHQGAQGSVILSPLNDTMWDLILDGAGGLVGGLLGSWYMKKSGRSLSRWKAFMTIVSRRINYE
jgi:hypothetical protein